MNKDTITMTLRYPNKSFGFDIQQITGCLDAFIREGFKHNRRKRYDCGSGRTLTIASRDESRVAGNGKG